LYVISKSLLWFGLIRNNIRTYRYIQGKIFVSQFRFIKMATPRINIDEPRYDQSTYWGRAKHFFITTNPLNVGKSSEELESARDIVTRYR